MDVEYKKICYMKKLWSIVDIRRVHEHFAQNEVKLYLADKYFNEQGYYTMFDLYLVLPENHNANMKLATLKIMEKGQKVGECVDVINSNTFYSFIMDEESAMLITIFLTPQERKELVKSLNICFSTNEVKDEDVYHTSVLRGINQISFVARQGRIEKIINSPLDIFTTINENKDRISGYFQ